MFLSDTTILDYIRSGDISITPAFDKKNIKPNSIRVHLHPLLIKYADQTVDPTKSTELKYSKISLENSSYTLQPKEFVLGSTKEIIQAPRDILAILDGRSTLARLGLNIHMSAMSIDGLYDAPMTITLEIFNAGNLSVVLSHNMIIGSLLFVKLDQPVASVIPSQYRGQKGPFPAQL